VVVVEPSTSKSVDEPSTSEAVVDPSTSKVVKAPRLEVHDDSPPKRRRVTRAGMEEKEALKEKARQAAEVSRKHKNRIQEPETLRLGKPKDRNRPAKKVNSDHAEKG
jgi:hypothetical protein